MSIVYSKNLFYVNKNTQYFLDCMKFNRHTEYMSNALEKKIDKVLDYLAVMTRENNTRFEAIDMRFEAIDKRFDAIDADLANLKGTTRRIEERQKHLENTVEILQNADRARQDHILQLDIRLGRVEDKLRSFPTPH